MLKRCFVRFRNCSEFLVNQRVIFLNRSKCRKGFAVRLKDYKVFQMQCQDPRGVPVSVKNESRGLMIPELCNKKFKSCNAPLHVYR